MDQTETEKFLTVFRSRFDNSQKYSKDWRQSADEALKFVTGDQWPKENRRQRKKSTRPTLTLNRVSQLVRLVSNQINQSSPGMKVIPVDSAADVKTAEAIYGIIKHIERNADAGLVYGTATDYQVRCGLGYFGFKTRYATNKSFEQELELRFFPNPLAVYGDPSSIQFDGSDSRFWIVIEKMAKEAFEEAYPNSKALSEGYINNTNDAQWMSKETVSVAEYWYVKTKKKTLYELHSGDTGFRDDFPQFEGMKAADFSKLVKRDREVVERKVHRAMTNGYEILEEDDWPGPYIPIIPVYGEYIVVNGKAKISGLIEYAKEPQQLLNYLVSCMAELLGIAPRTPWIVAAGQIEQYEKDWQEANINPPVALKYDPVPVTTAEGKEILAPPPTRNTYTPPIQPFAIAMQVFEQGIHHAVGLHGPSIGNLSSERSGKAISKLQQRGDTSTYHYVSNFARSIRFSVKMLVGDGINRGLIPIIYNEPGRIMRILGEDESVKRMAIGKKEDEGKIPKDVRDADDWDGVYDIGLGLYDVAADIGNALGTQRREAFEGLLQVLQSSPQLLPIIGDLVFKNADFPGAHELAKRFRDMRDPEAPEKLKEALGQMQEQMKQMGQELQEKARIIETKQLEHESKERIAAFQSDSEERVTVAKLQLEAAKLLAETLERAGDRESNEQLTEFKESISFLKDSLKSLEAKEPPPHAEEGGGS